ncbi:hypothetical protein BK120_17815 [Paenibacillus sp. FSL A5-0031]|uniref:hypothetical protein n=1 Tax=Paenibacillus sp. FSL A5-0031 TaxID=1920420 RepID=UPI00096D8EF6|nr:hypothetical protein [Paenibacillus sp. FSL A5-0031]OME81496.1 hypothetical protein BK120_17815 [Paenibacillus sp. FSL A5-0031]
MKQKRMFLLVVCVLIISIFASACTSNNGGGKDKETVEATNKAENTASPSPEATPDDGAPPVKDLGGYKFIVADNNANRWFPQEGSSDHANAIIDRIKWVEETYNVKIEVRKHSEVWRGGTGGRQIR